MDVAIRIESVGSRDERQKEGADRKSTGDLHKFPIGQSTIESRTIIIFSPVLSGNGQMAFSTRVEKALRKLFLAAGGLKGRGLQRTLLSGGERLPECAAAWRQPLDGLRVAAGDFDGIEVWRRRIREHIPLC
jgi:hypothetical protein